MGEPYAEYKRLTRRVLRRDGWKCRCPGCKARSNLHCHHVLFRSLGGRDTPDNLIVLCSTCHDAVHISRNLEITITPALDGSPITYEWKFLNGWSPTRSVK